MDLFGSGYQSFGLSLIIKIVVSKHNYSLYGLKHIKNLKINLTNLKQQVQLHRKRPCMTLTHPPPPLPIVHCLYSVLYNVQQGEPILTDSKCGKGDLFLLNLFFGCLRPFSFFCYSVFRVYWHQLGSLARTCNVSTDMLQDIRMYMACLPQILVLDSGVRVRIIPKDVGTLSQPVLGYHPPPICAWG